LKLKYREKYSRMTGRIKLARTMEERCTYMIDIVQGASGSLLKATAIVALSMSSAMIRSSGATVFLP
jgi:hypothetical protein